ncbi:phage holin family protein [Patescibacteria group bacterium]|nr:phage holin family protein [Patescibacteria group bacterium]
MNLILKFLATVGALFLSAYLIPGFTVESFYTASIVALLLGVLNITLKPILVLLTLPLNIITLGLFTFVINAGLILGIASFVEGFDVSGFVPALLGGLVIAIVGWVVDRIVK